MKKVILSVAVVAALLSAKTTNAQLIDEQNVTVTMDLQPILQLGMNGSQNIDFVFDQIAEYVGGITQYGATNLTVSSTVSWDLYAAGFSSAAAAGGTNADLIWDKQVEYGQGNDNNASTSLPLTLLELHQDKPNPNGAGGGVEEDYFTAFPSGTLARGTNNIYATATPYSRPSGNSKYIAGGLLPADAVVGGTYLVSQSSSVGASSPYYYSIDYRIVPGLPATFPRATTPATNGGNTATANDLGTAGNLHGAAERYAKPGVYTMNVKYVLVEN